MIKENSGFDLLSFYLIVSLCLIALVVLLLIKMNVTLRKMGEMEKEVKETHRKTDQVRTNLVYTAEEIKHKIEMGELAKEIIDRKAEEKAKEILAAIRTQEKKEEGAGV